VLLSAGVFVWRASRPHIAVIGRVAGTEQFRNEQRFQVQTQPGLLMLRIDENLFFGNAEAVLDRIQIELDKRPDTRNLVLVLSSVSHIDLSALDAFERAQSELAARGITLHLAEVKGPVLDRLQRSTWLPRLAHAPFASAHAAMQALSQPDAAVARSKTRANARMLGRRARTKKGRAAPRCS
jgi:sulfate permease, SulP family